MLPTTKITLLCALLLPLINTAYGKHGRHRSPSVKNHEVCEENQDLVCKAKTPQDLLQVTYDSSTHVLQITNETEHSGLVFDTNKHLVALFCNNTPLIIVIKYDEESGVLLQGQPLPEPPCLEDLYEQGKKSGTTFKVSSPSPDVSKYSKEILESVSKRCDPNPLCELIRLSKLLETALSCDCSKVITSVQSPIVFGYEKLIARFKAVVELFEQCSLLAKCTLNIGAVFYEPRGADVIKSLMQEVAKHNDVEKIFGNCLNTPECLVPLLSELEGNTTVGYGGLLHVVSAATRNCSHEIPPALVKYYTHPQENREDNCKQFKSDVQGIQSAANRHNPNGFVELKRFSQNVTSGSWQYSNLTNSLGQNDKRGGIAQMTRMGPQMSPFMSMPTYFVSIFQQFTQLDIHQVPQLIPYFDIGNLFGTIPAILGAIIRFPLTLLQFIEQAIEAGLLMLAEFWKMLPIIGTLFSVLTYFIAEILHLVLGDLIHSDEVQPILRQTALGLVHQGDPNGYGLPFGNDVAASLSGLPFGQEIFNNYTNVFPNVYGPGATTKEPCNESASELPPGASASAFSASGSGSSVVQSLEHAVVPLGKKKNTNGQKRSHNTITEKHKGANRNKHERRQKYGKREKHEKNEKRERRI